MPLKDPTLRAAYRRQRYLDNQERLQRESREWYAANRAEGIKVRKAYYEANKSRHIEGSKRWAEANPERVRQIKRAWAERNPNADREKRLRNPERYLAHCRNTKARVKGAEGTHTGEDVKAIWIQQGGKCAVSGCTYPISDKRNANKYHVDHIVPLARGGSNWPSNLQILCRFHNLQKWNKDEREWALAHGISIETKGKL